MKIYGGSDDLVEIEGCRVLERSIEDAANVGHGVTVAIGGAEIVCCELRVVIEIGAREAGAGQNGAGIRVVMTYASETHDAAVWSADVSPLDEDVPCPWTVTLGTEGYSVVVTIECPAGTPVMWRRIAEERRAARALDQHDRDQLDEALDMCRDLRDRFGDGKEETFTAFVERLVRERDAFEGALKELDGPRPGESL